MDTRVAALVDDYGINTVIQAFPASLLLVYVQPCPILLPQTQFIIHSLSSRPHSIPFDLVLFQLQAALVQQL